MMKLSEIIEKLQLLQKEHGNLDFCIEARGPAGDEGEVLGNDFVSLDFHNDSCGNFACLVAETKRRL
jgi:hypothetical protein